MLMDRLQFGNEYTRVVDPMDFERWNYELNEYGFWIKHQIAHFVNPGVIVELGVRSGYSAWAMMKAASPSSVLVGYDNYDPKYAEAYGVGLSERFHRHATKILYHHFGSKATIEVKDTSDPDLVLPVAELYHVDANHEYEAELGDIRKCIQQMLPSAVIAVHDFDAEQVRRAVMTAAREAGMTVCEICEPRNGDAIMVRGPMPDWVPRIGGRQVLTG